MNVEEIEGVRQESTLLKSVNEDRYRHFLRTMIRRHLQNPIPFYWREIDGLIAMLNKAANTGLKQLPQTGVPFRIFSVDHQGNISTFCPELLTTKTKQGRMTFGHVCNGGFDAIRANQRFHDTRTEIEKGRSRCEKVCDYFSLCGGGNPSNKMSEHGTFDAAETLACRFSRKLLIDEFLDYLEASEHEWSSAWKN